MKSAVVVIAALLFLSLPTHAANKPAPAAKTVYDYSLVALDGKVVPLSTYKGKVLMVVNLASQSIYKNQLHALEDLQKAYADKGLVLIGIPSEDFGKEELADNSAIQHFYVDTEHITFPVFGKASLRGKDEIPLAHFLTDAKTGLPGGDLHWNYTKFVIDREGKPVLRFEVDADPADPNFRVQIEQVLDGTFKKKDGPAEIAPKPPASDEDEG